MQIHNSFSFVTALRLKQLREEKGLSHQKLSEALSEQFDVTVSRDSLMNYEVATPNHSSAYKNLGMRIEYLHALASFYGVSADYLLGFTDVRAPFADTRAIVSKTGLTEENVRALEVMQEIPMQANLDMANDFLTLLVGSGICIDYLMMKTALNVPAPVSWGDLLERGEASLEDLAVIASDQRKSGYVQLTGEEAFEYHCSKIAKAVEKALIDKYKGTAKWGDSNSID